MLISDVEIILPVSYTVGEQEYLFDQLEECSGNKQLVLSELEELGWVLLGSALLVYCHVGLEHRKLIEFNGLREVSEVRDEALDCQRDSGILVEVD